MCLKNFGPSWRFLVLFLEFAKIKSSPKTGVSQNTKYLNTNPILTSHNYIQKMYYSKTPLFLQTCWVRTSSCWVGQGRCAAYSLNNTSSSPTARWSTWPCHVTPRNPTSNSAARSRPARPPTWTRRPWRRPRWAAFSFSRASRRWSGTCCRCSIICWRIGRCTWKTAACWYRPAAMTACWPSTARRWWTSGGWSGSARISGSLPSVGWFLFLLFSCREVYLLLSFKNRN